MKQIQHFIIDADLSQDSLRIEDKDLIHQMKDVLRFKAGDECIVLDGKGQKAHGKIEELHKRGALVTLEGVETCEPAVRAVRLFCAISKKPATFELIVQKATELGVTDIVPLISERTQVKELRKVERLHHIIREASEQSERCFLPMLHDGLRFNELIGSLPQGLVLAGDPWKYDLHLKDVEIPEDEDVNIIIGPEGGLSEKELEALFKEGAKLFLLGDTVLRMETAAIAAISVVQFS